MGDCEGFGHLSFSGRAGSRSTPQALTLPSTLDELMRASNYDSISSAVFHKALPCEDSTILTRISGVVDQLQEQSPVEVILFDNAGQIIMPGPTASIEQAGHYVFADRSEIRFEYQTESESTFWVKIIVLSVNDSGNLKPLFELETSLLNRRS